MKAIAVGIMYAVYRVLDLFPDPRAFTSFTDLKQVNWNHQKEARNHAR